MKKFQTSSQVRLGLLSVTAAGVGLTLTAATSVIFAELHWTPGILAQAEDRCHRIGQTNAVNVMYCVCKDRELSIDLMLWGMLSKKVSCLGRMIEGQKGVKMTARETENNAPSEQELASSFASTCPNNNVEKIQGKPIVKGSIQSFFLKKNRSEPKTLSGKSVAKRKFFNPDDRVTSPPPKNSMKSIMKWQCNLCTFINERKRNTLRMKCEMCNTPYFGTPNPSSKATDLNSKTKKVQHERDVILLDGDDLFNSYDNPSCDVISLSSTDDLDCNNRDPSSIVSYEDQSETLTFNVSKNSGRVAIHGPRGEPLFVNFDINDIIADGTSDLLFETKVKRNLIQDDHFLPKAQVHFNDPEVEKGQTNSPMLLFCGYFQKFY